MKFDPKLLARLEEVARATGRDANAMLAAALGVCPTCKQTLPGGAGAPTVHRQTAKRAAILAWRSENPHGSQNACSKALGVSQGYVGRVWHEADNTNGGESDDTEG